MKDVNNILFKAYYDAIKTLGYPTFEGEEPDNLTDKAYIVLNDINSTETSTKTSSQTQSDLQVTINTWDNQYVSSLSANNIADLIFDIVKPLPQSTFTAGSGISIITTKVTSDRTVRYGSLGDRKYLSRIIIFSHYIYIQN